MSSGELAQLSGQFGLDRDDLALVLKYSQCSLDEVRRWSKDEVQYMLREALKGQGKDPSSRKPAPPKGPRVERPPPVYAGRVEMPPELDKPPAGNALKARVGAVLASRRFLQFIDGVAWLTLAGAAIAWLAQKRPRQK